MPPTPMQAWFNLPLAETGFGPGCVVLHERKNGAASPATVGRAQELAARPCRRCGAEGVVIGWMRRNVAVFHVRNLVDPPDNIKPLETSAHGVGADRGRTPRRETFDTAAALGHFPATCTDLLQLRTRCKCHLIVWARH